MIPLLVLGPPSQPAGDWAPGPPRGCCSGLSTPALQRSAGLLPHARPVQRGAGGRQGVRGSRETPQALGTLHALGRPAASVAGVLMQGSVPPPPVRTRPSALAAPHLPVPLRGYARAAPPWDPGSPPGNLSSQEERARARGTPRPEVPKVGNPRGCSPSCPRHRSAPLGTSSGWGEAWSCGGPPARSLTGGPVVSFHRVF